MTGNISVSDHTVLFLVCNHMAGDRTTDLDELRNELGRMSFAGLQFSMHTCSLRWRNDLSPERPIEEQEPPRANISNRRPRRQRRAPDRLNIGSTQGSSYDS